VRFVPQDALPAGTAYEQFIFDTGRARCAPACTTSSTAWSGCAFRTKRALNELQAQEIAARRHRRAGAARCATRSPCSTRTARCCRRRSRSGRRCSRATGGGCSSTCGRCGAGALLVVGHALLEKLATPRKDLTAHVWRARAPDVAFADADAWLAAAARRRPGGQAVHAAAGAGRARLVAGNENFSFYDDSLVFRPRGPEPITTTTTSRDPAHLISGWPSSAARG
jgi:hypothetical protein